MRGTRKILMAGAIGLAAVSLPTAAWSSTAAANAPHHQAKPTAASPNTATGAQSLRMADRFFRAKVNIYGRDDETWPEKDENTNRDYGPFEGILGGANRDYYFQIPHTGWGGECRVEVIQTKAHVRDDGSIELTGTARLFEGTSEQTDQLRDEEFFSVVVPRKTENQYHQVHLSWGGGDFADVKFWLTNIVNE